MLETENADLLIQINFWTLLINLKSKNV